MLTDLLPAPLNQLGASHLSVAGVALLLGAKLKPKIDAALRALPDYLIKREKARFEAAVASGQIPPAAARLARKLKRAVLEWADEELPAALGEDKMARGLATLQALPYIGALVAADPKGVEAELQLEYDAWRGAIKKEAAPVAPAAAAPAASAPASDKPS